MTNLTWTLEIYDRHGVEPKRVEEIASVSDAKAVIHHAWRNRTGEIFRFLSHGEMSREDKDALSDFDAQPTFG